MAVIKKPVIEPAAPKETRINAAYLLAKLKATYGGAGSIIVSEMCNSSGGGATRRLDAMAFGVWPSRGCYFTGFEIKVSRQDWLKELQQIDKAEVFRPHCQYFYLVTGPNVAELHEIPETWGWLNWDGRKLATVKRAPVNKAVPMPGSMLAGFFNRLMDGVVNEAYQRGKNEVAEERAQIDKRIKEGVDIHLRYGKEKAAAVDSFISKLGMHETWEHSHYKLAALAADDDTMAIIKDFMTANKTDKYGSMKYSMNSIMVRLGEIVAQYDAAKNLQQAIEKFEAETADPRDVLIKPKGK